MCGRARQTFDWFHIKIDFGHLFDETEWDDARFLPDEAGADTAAGDGAGPTPNWNAAPRQHLIIIRKDAAGRARILRMEWGFVARWERDPLASRRPINAKIESIKQALLSGKGMWRDPFKSRRCIFPVNGFYEWQAVPGRSRKQAWKIDMADGSLMPLAALWDEWTDRATGETLLTFAVITTPPNQAMARIHDRQPVILAPQDQQTWLAGSVEAAFALCRPCADEALAIAPVSDRVGNVRNNDPSLIDPPPTDLLGMF